MKKYLLFLLPLALACSCGKVELSENDDKGNPNTPEEPDLEYDYKVGDFYSQNGKEGIVFWITDGGRHGRIVSTDETQYEWSTECVKTSASDLDDGMANMQKIQAISGWHEKYPAFAWCADKGDGWYLPAENELKFLYKSNVVELQNFGYYWSSTEDNTLYAKFVYMLNGYTGNLHKCDTYYVRAVRAF